MEVYILRHAIAVKRQEALYPDDERPLTEKGAEKMELGAKGIAKIVPELDVILTSRLPRAYETALITAGAFGREEIIETCDELLPGKPVSALFSLLARYRNRKRVLLVGHETGLGTFASALIGAQGPVIQFKKGGLCRIDTTEAPLQRAGRLTWHLTPPQLRALGRQS